MAIANLVRSIALALALGVVFLVILAVSHVVFHLTHSHVDTVLGVLRSAELAGNANLNINVEVEAGTLLGGAGALIAALAYLLRVLTQPPTPPSPAEGQAPRTENDEAPAA